VTSVRLAIVACVLATLAGAGPASAATTGLLLIPTADTIGANQYQLQLEMDGSSPPAGVQYWFLDTEAGLGDKWELGVDINLPMTPRPRVLANWKYAFAPVDPGRAGGAVGIDTWDERLASGGYVLGTADLGPIRLTAGGTYLFGAGRLLAGIDTGFRHRLTWMADYVSGNGLYSSVGFNYSAGRDVQVQAGLIFPNDGGNTFFTVQVAWGGKFALIPR
jgi:hypothetical protein